MTAIITQYGEFLYTIQGNQETVDLNTPEGCRAVDDPPRHLMRYNGMVWEGLPPSPGAGFYFDYKSNSWLDTRSILDVREAKWNEIKMQRDQLEFGGFEFDGNIYDSDQVSQGRIMGAAMAGVDQVWTLADNTTVELSASQLQQLYAALQAHIASVHERGRIARQKIETALTYEEIEAVNF
ncbi:DUF4376 domain-containing protein [Acinetobacter baumannii]